MESPGHKGAHTDRSKCMPKAKGHGGGIQDLGRQDGVSQGWNGGWPRASGWW